jgi:hypothetical protein
MASKNSTMEKCAHAFNGMALEKITEKFAQILDFQHRQEHRQRVLLSSKGSY